MIVSNKQGLTCNQIFRQFLLAACLLVGVSVVKAQTPAVFEDPGGQTGGDGNGSFGDGPVVPLDGGMSLLLAAMGLGYTSRKLRANELNK